MITLDNPHNPIVWLRNRLPFAWLSRLGLVPYYVGATCGRTEIRERLATLGFAVADLIAVAHAPRAPAIWLAALAHLRDRRWAAAGLERLLWGFEALGRWPTRYWTGYYLAVRAEKRAGQRDLPTDPIVADDHSDPDSRDPDFSSDPGPGGFQRSPQGGGLAPKTMG